MGLRAVIYGVGPIGSLIAKVALRRGIEVAGAIDIDPQKVGKDLGEVIGLERTIGVRVSDNADKVLQEVEPDVVFHATVSWLDKAYPQIMKAVKVGADVISTCETLSYPWYRYPELAELLDNYARAHNSTVLGTGVNPGYIFDTLPALLTTPIAELKSIKAVRSLDAGKRRYSFQKKIGLGMTPEEFAEKLSGGEITAHVGYAESALLLADILGIKVDKVEERQEAIVADQYYETQYFKINPGHVRGVSGVGIGYKDGEEVIRLEFRAGAGLEDYEEITLEGEPTIRWRSTGTPGDIATVAVVINLVPKVLNARPGLITMKDLLNVSYAAQLK